MIKITQKQSDILNSLYRDNLDQAVRRAIANGKSILCINHREGFTSKTISKILSKQMFNQLQIVSKEFQLIRDYNSTNINFQQMVDECSSSEHQIIFVDCDNAPEIYYYNEENLENKDKSGYLKFFPGKLIVYLYRTCR